MPTVKPPKRPRHTPQSNGKYLDALEDAVRVFPYPSPEGKARLHFESEPEGENTHRSLTGLYDWDEVDRANRDSKKGN